MSSRSCRLKSRPRWPPGSSIGIAPGGMKRSRVTFRRAEREWNSSTGRRSRCATAYRVPFPRAAQAGELPLPRRPRVLGLLFQATRERSSARGQKVRTVSREPVFSVPWSPAKGRSLDSRHWPLVPGACLAAWKHFSLVLDRFPRRLQQAAKARKVKWPPPTFAIISPMGARPNAARGFLEQ